MDSMELCCRYLERWAHGMSSHASLRVLSGIHAHRSQAWDLLEGKTLFSARKADGSFSDGVHFSELIAALGPPPRDLLNRHHERALEYWDENGTSTCILLIVRLVTNSASAHAGNWGGFVPVPSEKTLDAAETKLKDKTKFLRFMRRVLAWDPKMRPTAKELMTDPWLLEEA